MLGRTLIGFLLVTLMIAPSNAADAEQVGVRDPRPCHSDSRCKPTGITRLKCYKALAAVESQVYEEVKAKTLDEKQIDELNFMLDQADQYCKKGKYKQSEAKIEAVIRLLIGSPAEKVD
jgi:hypothetical protein